MLNHLPTARLLRLLPGLASLLSLLVLLCGGPARAEGFLPVDEAFRPTLSAEGSAVKIHFEIAEGYHLYRERMSLETTPEQSGLQDTQMPDGIVQYDPNLEQDMEFYSHQVAYQGRFEAAASSTVLHLNYQGCAEAGLCYPPQTRDFRIGFSGGQIASIEPIAIDEDAPVETPTDTASSVAASAPAAGVAESSAAPAPAASGPEGDGIATALASGHLLKIAGVFLIAGVLLSFTPCVLPMVPILSSIIVGQGNAVSRGKGFSLAVSYSLGMALTYTLFGVAAGLLGEGLAAWLQNPWVLGSFGLMLVALALSMFGVYELQLPAALQTRVTMTANGLPGGKLASVFGMGALSALIVGPCVAGPLAGALIFISQTRDVLVGATALFSLACGMSVPLLLVGLSAGSLLPRTGRWMESVKTVFGVMLLGVAWWLVSPVLPPSISLLLAALLLAISAAFLGAFNALDPKAGLGARAAKASGWLLACVSVMQLIGALSGASSAFRPLEALAQRGGGTLTAVAENKPQFRRVQGPDGLKNALAESTGRYVMLDFYADWCVACKEMEHLTFSDPRVQARFSDIVLLQADVTANNAADRALMKQFGLFGPPGVLFFDRQGGEISAARVIGFQKAEAFLTGLERHLR